MTRFSGVATFLRRHPVISLALLSPGIPEYLSSSSPLNSIILNPVFFPIQLALNLGLYVPGVLLVREAMIRWRKGLGSVLLLGAAYGILEEGVALSTLFYSNAQPVGNLGYYGHWAGVNWIWVAGILPVHMIFSITIPIVLLGLALPYTRGEPFLSGRKLPATVTVLVIDVIVLMLFVFGVTKFWMGTPVFVGSLLSIAALVYAARRIPADLVRPTTDNPARGPITTLAIGIVFYPCVLLAEGLGEGSGLPAVIDFPLVIAVQALFLVFVLRSIGSQNNERQSILLALGLILPIAAFGVVSEIGLPVILFADVAFALFMRKLLHKYPSSKGLPRPTAG
jgi:hypothetical protein